MNRQRLENRRQQIDVTRALEGHARLEELRLKDDEGDPERGFIREDSVRRLAVLSERFAVIGGEDDQRLPISALADQRLDEWRQRGIGRRHLAKIEVALKSRGERLGRRIGKMRLVDVHPAEVWCAAVDPAPRKRDGLRPATLLLEERGAGLRVDEAVVVHVEAAIQAKS